MNSPDINPETEKVRIRETASYKRLKAKFTDGEMDVKEGIQSDSLTVGDLADMFLLFGECMPVYRQRIEMGMDNLGLAAQAATEDISLSEKEEKEINSEITFLWGRKNLEQIRRETNPLYSLKVDLFDLPRPINRSFEIIHNPSVGLLMDRGLFRFILAKSDPGDYLEPFVETIFAETGIPVGRKVD